MIAVVDYQKGNLKSVERGLVAAGGEALITADASEIARADAIVLPGVGPSRMRRRRCANSGRWRPFATECAQASPFWESASANT